jgi:hypothetical protein
VKLHAEEPFAIVGINTDDDPDAYRKSAAELGVTWTNAWQGGFGAISQAWGVRGYPTIFVLDAQGVIRFRDVRGAALDAAVKALLAEMER